jgi:hypothetical protein
VVALIEITLNENIKDAEFVYLDLYSDICGETFVGDNILVLGNPVKVNVDVNRGIDCSEAFHWLLKSTGRLGNDTDILLNWEEFSKGYALYVFDIEPTFRDRGFLSLIKQGIVRITANFANPLPTSVTCVILSDSLGLFEINNVRDIIVYQ